MKVDLKNQFCIVSAKNYTDKSIQSISFTSIRNIQLKDEVIKENVNYIHLFALLQKLGNAFSKEDFKQIEKRTSLLLKHNKNNLPELMKLRGNKSHHLLKLLEDSGVKIKNEDGIIKYSDETDKINTLMRKKIKDIRLQQVAIREATKHCNPSTILTNTPSIGDWFKGFEKIPQLPMHTNSLLEHPIDKALFLVGQFTEKELKLVNKKTLAQRHLSTGELLSEKKIILNELTSILNRPNKNFYGAFNNKELKKIKNLSLNYSSFNKELIQRGIYSKDIESVLFNSNNKLSGREIGENIDGCGFIIRKSKTYDKELQGECPTLTVFSDTSSKKIIKMVKIDENFENEVAKFKEDYERFCDSTLTNNNDWQVKMSSFNEKAKSIIEKEKKLVVSEISFSILDKKLAEVFIDEMPKPLKNNDILKVVQENNLFPLVIDYINHDTQRYPNGGQDVSMSLLHLLFKHNCPTLLIKALAINSNRSPVGMYLKIGFEPVSHTKEKIVEQILDPKGFDYKEPVWLYLPANSKLKKIIEARNPLKEIFELSPNKA